MNYHEKYLKYKIKYTNEKTRQEQNGGIINRKQELKKINESDNSEDMDGGGKGDIIARVETDERDNPEGEDEVSPEDDTLAPTGAFHGGNASKKII